MNLSPPDAKFRVIPDQEQIPHTRLFPETYSSLNESPVTVEYDPPQRNG